MLDFKDVGLNVNIKVSTHKEQIQLCRFMQTVKQTNYTIDYFCSGHFTLHVKNWTPALLSLAMSKLLKLIEL